MKKTIILIAFGGIFLSSCSHPTKDAWSNPIIFNTCVRSEYPYDKPAPDKLQQFNREFVKAPRDKDIQITSAPFEYCDALDSTKGIFLAEVGKGGTGIFRYDREDGAIQEASFLSGSLLSYVPSDESFFLDEPLQSVYKRLKSTTERSAETFEISKGSNDGKVSFIVYSRLLHRLRDSNNHFPFLTQSDHESFCTSSIQSGCLVDLYYTYDYLQNHLWLAKACTFVLKPDGQKQVLEECQNFPGHLD